MSTLLVVAINYDVFLILLLILPVVSKKTADSLMPPTAFV
jgi:hypothetical protein